MADVLPPRDDDDEPIDHHRANYVYPPRPLPGPPCDEPALSWRPHPAIMARAPPFPFLRKAGPITGSFWAMPGLLMCGPDPRWERRGATERLEYDFRIAEVVSDDVVVQARNLAPHLVEGPPIYVCGRGARAFAAYLLAQLYDLPLALACVDLERLGGCWASNYLRGSEWPALLRAFSDDCADDASASVSFSSSCADDDDDGVVLAAFEAGVVTQRSAWYARCVR
jgi:hypothetical protein